jgi:hypothetical protein
VSTQTTPSNFAASQPPSGFIRNRTGEIILTQ